MTTEGRFYTVRFTKRFAHVMKCPEGGVMSSEVKGNRRFYTCSCGAVFVESRWKK